MNLSLVTLITTAEATAARPLRTGGCSVRNGRVRRPQRTPTPSETGMRSVRNGHALRPQWGERHNRQYIGDVNFLYSCCSDSCSVLAVQVRRAGESGAGAGSHGKGQRRPLHRRPAVPLMKPPSTLIFPSPYKGDSNMRCEASSPPHRPAPYVSHENERPPTTKPTRRVPQAAGCTTLQWPLPACPAVPSLCAAC